METVRVLYDYQAFTWQKYGGVSNCFAQLIAHLPKDIKYHVAIKETDNVHLKDAGISDARPIKLYGDNFLGTKFFPGKYRLYRYFTKLFPMLTADGQNSLEAINCLQQGNFDVFHPTFFDPYFLKYLHGKPFVLTIHDMIPELVYENHDDPQVARKALLAKQASHIIAVSEKTKEDIIKVLHIPDEKITVIPHGVVTCKPQPVDIRYKYILYVGGRNLPYKNFRPMVRSLSPFLREHKDVNLLCTGPGFTKEEQELFRNLDIYSQVKHKYCSDAELAWLYSHALLFVFPSLYEGFGIPILEAYQNNCPVFVNNTSCFPEVCGDAAIYFELNSKQDTLVKAINSFLGGDREGLLNLQRERLKKYSWERSSRMLAEVYKQVINHHMR